MHVPVKPLFARKIVLSTERLHNGLTHAGPMRARKHSFVVLAGCRRTHLVTKLPLSSPPRLVNQRAAKDISSEADLICSFFLICAR